MPYTQAFIQAFGRLLSPASKRFYAALNHPEQAQKAVQQKLIHRLRSCAYGKHFKIKSVEDWHRLPIVSYEDLQPWLPEQSTHQTAAKFSRNNPLTPEPILFYEPTSGSSGPKKYIPYTRSLRRSFNHLFCIWAHDLITHGPQFSTGKLYFSISPSFSKASSTSGTTDDSDYLDPWLRWLLSSFLVRAPIAHTPEAFRDTLARSLLKAHALEIISIWSPSFLTAQLNYIQRYQKRFQTALQGEISEARSHMLSQNPIPWAELWPQLKLISCWNSAIAADGARGLRSRFPNTLVQGKGLLATEAPMTVPLIAANGHLPLLDEIYFEFEDEQGQCHLLHQLNTGQTYNLIISQLG
ncbi:MAG: GH3 auxin-responsive promoter family protein, partial [Cyanobacteria bacterium J06632_3]